MIAISKRALPAVLIALVACPLLSGCYLHAGRPKIVVDTLEIKPDFKRLDLIIQKRLFQPCLMDDGETFEPDCVRKILDLPSRALSHQSLGEAVESISAMHASYTEIHYRIDFLGSDTATTYYTIKDDTHPLGFRPVLTGKAQFNFGDEDDDTPIQVIIPIEKVKPVPPQLAGGWYIIDYNQEPIQLTQHEYDKIDELEWPSVFVDTFTGIVGQCHVNARVLTEITDVSAKVYNTRLFDWPLKRDEAMCPKRILLESLPPTSYGFLRNGNAANRMKYMRLEDGILNLYDSEDNRIARLVKGKQALREAVIVMPNARGDGDGAEGLGLK